MQYSPESQPFSQSGVDVILWRHVIENAALVARKIKSLGNSAIGFELAGYGTERGATQEESRLLANNAKKNAETDVKKLRIYAAGSKVDDEEVHAMFMKEAEYDNPMAIAVELGKSKRPRLYRFHFLDIFGEPDSYDQQKEAARNDFLQRFIFDSYKDYDESMKIHRDYISSEATWLNYRELTALKQLQRLLNSDDRRMTVLYGSEHIMLPYLIMEANLGMVTAWSHMNFGLNPLTLLGCKMRISGNFSSVPDQILLAALVRYRMIIHGLCKKITPYEEVNEIQRLADSFSNETLFFALQNSARCDDASTDRKEVAKSIEKLIGSRVKATNTKAEKVTISSITRVMKRISELY